MIVSRSIINRTFFKSLSAASIALNNRLFHTPFLVSNKHLHTILSSPPPQIRFAKNHIVGLNHVSVRFNHQEAALKPEAEYEEQEPNNHVQKVKLLIEQQKSEEAFKYFQSNVTLGGAIHLIRHCLQTRTQQSMDRGFEIYNILTTNQILPNSKFFSPLLSLCNTFNPSKVLNLYKKMKKLQIPLGLFAFREVVINAFKTKDSTLAKNLSNLIIKGVNFKVATDDCKYLLTVFGESRYYLNANSLATWMEKNGLKLDVGCYIHLLKACSGRYGVQMGNTIYEKIMKTEFSDHPDVLQALSEMFLAHYKTEQSFEIFKRIPEPSLIAYNRIISLCVKQERPFKAVEYFEDLRKQKLVPNKITYLMVLSAFGQMGAKGLQKGKEIHHEITTLNLDKDIALINPLILMYAKCGEPQKAIGLYDEIFNQKNNDLKPDFYTFSNVLSAVSYIGPPALEKGKKIHELLTSMNLTSDAKILGALIQMYAKCGEPSTSFELYDKMVENKITPTPVLFSNVLTIISNLGPSALKMGKQVHQQINKHKKFFTETNLIGSLIQMYNKCGDPKKALEIFDKAERNQFFKLDTILLNNALTSVSLIGPEALEKGKLIHQLLTKLKFNQVPLMLHNALIQMYHKCGDTNKSFEIYDSMINKNSETNYVTFYNMLKICASVGPSALERGKKVHEKMVEKYLDKSGRIPEALKEMYEKCGNATQDKSESVDRKHVPDATNTTKDQSKSI